VTIKDLSLKLAAVSLIADEAYKTKNRLRAELQAEMDAIGADRVKAEMGDETIAYVLTTKPKFKWVVKNDRKFVEWVRANCPAELVESVRESSIDSILNKFNYSDDFVIDPNGEVVDWLEGGTAEPYLTTKFNPDGKAILRDAIVGNQLDARKMIELE
jgi:hypothetical protein